MRLGLRLQKEMVVVGVSLPSDLCQENFITYYIFISHSEKRKITRNDHPK